MSRAPLATGRRRRSLRPCALAAGVLAVAMATACDADHASLGRERYAARDYSGAVEELTWALRDRPDDAALRLLLARAQAHTSHKFDAKLNLQEVRKHPGLRSAASQELVKLLLAEKGFAAADAVIDDETKEAPDDPAWLELRGIANLARADFELKDYGKALRSEIGDGPAASILTRLAATRTTPSDASFEQAVEGWIRDMETRHGLSDPAAFRAAAARARELTRKAQADFVAASSTDPSRFLALLQLGRMAVDRSDTAAARKHLGAVIAIDDTALPDAEAKVAYAKQRGLALDLLSAHLEEADAVADSIALLEKEHESGWLETPMLERLGRQYVETGALERAGTLADELAERDPRSTWSSYLRGVVSFRQGRFDEAVTYLNRAQVQLPSNATVNAALARALVKVGRDAQASEHFRLALAGGRSRDAGLTIEYAETLAREDDPDQAAQYLEDRLRSAFANPRSPDHQRILDQVRKFSALAGIGAKSLEDARSALLLNPRSVFAKLLVAKYEHEAGLSTLALPRCREVTDQYPGLADGWLLTARILADLGRHGEAVAPLQKAALLRPDDANIPWLQGRIALKRSRLDEARRELGRALEIDPALPGPRLDLVEVEIQAKNSEAARRHCEVLAERHGDDPLIRRAVGLTRLALQDAAGAIGPLEQAVAALPGDHALRLDLARARMQAGQAEAGRAALLGLATDAAVPTDVRVDAADALRRASAFPEAAKAYDALFDAATGEDERQQLSEKAFWARFWSGDHGHALDDLVRMRLAGRKLQAERLFVAAAERLRFDREAGAQADLLRAADGHDAESLRAAHRAHSRLGQWHKALEDLADLARLDPDRAADLAIDRGTALVALGKTAEAAEIAKRALAGPSPGSRAWRLQLELARAASDKPGIETALREVLGRSPGDMEARLAAARALAGLGDLDGAASILTATPFKGPDREGTIVAAAILVAAQNPRGAAVLLDAAPDRGGPVAEVRALVAVLVDAEPAASARLAAMLRGLAKQNLEAASSAVDAMAAPAALKEQWKAILLAVQGRPEQASAAAADLARARIFAESRVFADKADVILRLLAEKAGPRARTFDLVRAWWKLEAANPKAAADVAVPMLEPRGATPMVSLVAALAAADLSGESSAIKVLDGAPEPVSDVFLSDVAHGLAARGMHAGALRAATKLATPGDRDRALLFLLAVERRDGKEARRLLKTVPDGWWSRPTIRAAATWTALQNDATKAAGEAELEAIATDPRELARVDALVLYEAALLSGKSAIASTILAHAQRSVRFDPAGIQRFVEVLRRLQADKPALQTLEERLRVVDPSGKLRVAAGRPVRVD